MDKQTVCKITGYADLGYNNCTETYCGDITLNITQSHLNEMQLTYKEAINDPDELLSRLMHQFNIAFDDEVKIDVYIATADCWVPIDKVSVEPFPCLS